MRHIVLFTEKSVFNWFNQIQYSRLTPTSGIYVQKCGKSSIASSNKTTDKLIINKNMTLRYCHPKTVTDYKEEDKKKGKLVVLFSWMLSKEHHLEKFRNLYFKRGFDVLTIRTSPLELLLPQRGSQRIAKSALNFMNEKVEEYPQIVIHAFSVGGYQFGEVLVEMEKKSNESKLKIMCKAIKGVICDSGADMEAIPKGLSRAVTDNRLLAKILKNYITLHMKVFYTLATKHYMASSQAFKNLIIRCPGLLLVSNDDVVGNPEANQRVMKCWQNNGVEVQWKCFDTSSHVGHLYKYPEEYEREVDTFLKKVIK